MGTKISEYYIDGVEYNGSYLQFISTPFGRIRKSGSNWIYDYFLKDHLGNVRVVLEAGSASGSSSGNSVTYLATMEENRATEENQYFANVDATRADRPFNYPDANPMNTKVSKVPGKSEGLKITLKVMAGDTLEISAKAFYNMDNAFPSKSLNVVPIVGAVLASMTNPVNNIIGESSQLANDLGTVASSSTILSQIPEENLQNNLVQPKSGLNFVLYNSRFDVIEANTGYLPVNDKINAIQVLSTDKLVMTEAGFIEIFANNEAQTPVYYDNMMVTMTSGPVMEVNAYYPYGMMITDLSLPALPAKYNAYKFGAKELQTELGLNWGDFGQRMQDPVIGRFMVPDRFAEKYYHLSPYQYAANNPINIIDINGDSLYVNFIGDGAQELFEKIMNDGFNGQFTTNISASGNVTFAATKNGGDINKLSKCAQNFYNAVNGVATNSKYDVKLGVYNGSDEVHTGSYKDNAIDVGDMNQFANFDHDAKYQPSATKQGKMAHEIREQYSKSISKIPKGSDREVEINHNIAIGFEDAVNGNFRRKVDINPGRDQGMVQQYTRPDGTINGIRIIGGQNSRLQRVITVVPY